MIEAVVIGPGHAGLGVSYHLARRGIEHTVVERGRVSESWRSQRWDEPPDAFVTGEAHVAHLQAYADAQRLPIRTGLTVTGVAARSRDGGFVVSADGDGGRAVEIETRNVAVASGVQRLPKIPAIAEALPLGIRQLHAADYRRPGDLPSGAVLIVGTAQSGVRIAEDLLDAGRTVYLCTSAVARFRRRYQGRDAMEWFHDARFYDVTVEQLTDQRIRFAKQPAISGVGRFGHTVSLQFLAERGAILLGRPSAIEGDRLLMDDTVGANIAFADARSADFNVELEKASAASGTRTPGARALSGRRAAPRSDVSSVAARAGPRLGGDLGYLRVPVFDPDGVPARRRRGRRVHRGPDRGAARRGLAPRRTELD